MLNPAFRRSKKAGDFMAGILIVFIKLILRICTAVFLFLFFCYAYFLFANLIALIRGSQTDWETVNFISHYKKSRKDGSTMIDVVVLTFLVGAINIVCSTVFSSTQIGAFYEKSSYSECYEATLYVDNKPIFCLVDMSKEQEESNSGMRDFYYLSKIYLPYGKSQFIDDGGYDPTSDTNFFYLGEESILCNVVLHSPASNDSYEKLLYEVIASYGEFCGSRKSDIFHFVFCNYVDSISPENLVFFESEAEAHVLGYTMCDFCWQNYR